MDRITVKDVRGMFVRACEAAKSAGIDSSGWALREAGGSTSYALIMRPYGSLDVGFGRDHLGNTAREAYTALLYLARAWELLREIPSEQNRKAE